MSTAFSFLNRIPTQRIYAPLVSSTTMYYSDDGGYSWLTKTLIASTGGYGNSQYATNGNVTLFSRGGLNRTTDRGVTWGTYAAPGSNPVGIAKSNVANTWLMGVSAGTFYTSTNNGTSWSSTLATGRTIIDFSIASSATYDMMINDITAYWRLGSGSWNSIALTGGATDRVLAQGNNYFLILDYNNSACRRSPSNTTPSFTNTTSPVSSYPNKFKYEHDRFFILVNGTIWHSTDGATWTSVSTSGWPYTRMRDVVKTPSGWLFSADNGFGSGGLYMTNNSFTSPVLKLSVSCWSLTKSGTSI